MKKILLIVLSVFLLSGCSAVRINTTSIDNIHSVILSKNNDLFNRVGKGYKYYIPRELSYVDSRDGNEILYSEGMYYYLYIDSISYYYKKELSYTDNPNAYYSTKLNYNNKTGYIEINYKKELNKYLVEFMYNYAKIEVMVDKNRINDVILNSSYILSTIKFNDNIIKLNIDNETAGQKEEIYDIFTIKKDNSNDYKLEILKEEIKEEKE